ncbi:MAG: ABC transporter permease, partial [Solirubrobacterales bacterium]|nr:ABC transporter permease [Solirubrobacterales bacterium]
MRWLLRKDLLILRRSRLLVAVLVLYPALIALLIGLAISRSPSRPRVAVVNLTPPGETFTLGGRQLQVGEYASQFLSQVDAVKVATRAQALAKVASGSVLAAVVIPANIIQRITSGTEQGTVEVLYNGNALQQSFVHTTLAAALSQANLGLSQEIRRVAVQDLDLLLSGGEVSILGAPRSVLGLSKIAPVLRRAAARQPPGPERRQLDQIASFADFAARNLGVSADVLKTVSQPIAVHETLLHGRRTPLDTFAVVVAVAISLMFVCVLLAAGSVALEREEHSLPRLLRGPPALVSHETLLSEKVLLATICAFALALVMLAGV